MRAGFAGRFHRFDEANGLMLRYNPPLVVLKLKILRYVQTHRHFCSASTAHTPDAYHLWVAIEKGIAGVLRIQETDRSVCLGDLVHNWVRDSVLDRRADSFLMAMTLHYLSLHHTQNGSGQCPC